MQGGFHAGANHAPALLLADDASKGADFTSIDFTGLTFDAHVPAGVQRFTLGGSEHQAILATARREAQRQRGRARSWPGAIVRFRDCVLAIPGPATLLLTVFGLVSLAAAKHRSAVQKRA